MSIADEARSADVAHAIESIEQTELKDASLELTESRFFRGIHPLGWTVGAVLIIAVAYHTVLDTEYLIGNLAAWQWVALAIVVALALRPVLLHRLRVAIESVSTVTRTIAWILAWAVFGFQLFNVITRYGNDLVDQDILFGEVVSLAGYSFALMFLIGVNFGIRDGVNPRIDFWWANFHPKTKATLDFVIHALLLFPFVWMAIRISQPYAATSLGRRFNGEWPSGHRVWETWEQSTDAGQLPVGPMKAMILVSFVLFGLQLIAELIKTGFVMMGNSEYGKLKAVDAPQRIE